MTGSGYLGGDRTGRVSALMTGTARLLGDPAGAAAALRQTSALMAHLERGVMISAGKRDTHKGENGIEFQAAISV